MFFRSFLLPGVIVPMVCAAAAAAAAGWWRRQATPASLGGGAIGVGAAFVSAYVAISGWPRFPPVESTQRLFYWIALLSILAFAWGRFKQVASPWPIRGAAVAVMLWGILRAPIQNSWSFAEVGLWLGGLLAAGLAMDRALERSLAVTSGRAALEAAAVRLAVLGGSAVLLGLSGTARLAQLMGAVACGVFVVEVLAWRLRRRAWLAGDAIVLVTVFLGLLLGGYFYAELGALPAALLICSVLLLGLGSRPGTLRWLPLVPLLVATALVAWSFLHQEDDPYDYYGWRPGAGEEGGLRGEGNTQLGRA